MKRLLFFSLFLLEQPALMAQEDSMEITVVPTLTQPGKPTGEKTKRKVSKEGGRLYSYDGRLELIIPAGALPEEKTISIQAVNNALEPGRGDAYELEPSGLAFRKPLQLTFHYGPREALGVIPALKGIAWQAANGQWNQLDNTFVDTLAHTITGYITHFSQWTSFDTYILRPSSGRVKVNHQIPMTIEYISCPGSTFLPFFTGSNRRVRYTITVNGIRNGNAAVGRTSPLRSNVSFTYTAPAQVPDRNPVAISVETSDLSFVAGGITYHSLRLLSNITIIDRSYELTFISYNYVESSKIKIWMEDSASCVVTLRRGIGSLVDIRNRNCVIRISGQDDCPLDYYNAAECTGPVDISGAARIFVTPAQLPVRPYDSVAIMFIRKKAIFPLLRQVGQCKGEFFYWPYMLINVPAAPYVAFFYGKDAPQELDYLAGDSNNDFKMIVKPADDNYQ